MKKITVFTSIIFVIVTGLFLVFVTANGSGEQEKPVVYIAHLNNMVLPVTHYKLYLRENVHYFENRAGAVIWQTNLGGMTSIEVVKNQALESFVTVLLTNQQTGHPYTGGLTQQELEQAYSQALTFWNDLTPEEQDIFDIETIRAVNEDIILHENIRAYMTQNYVEHQQDDRFWSMLDTWRQEAELTINFEVWDAISIEELRP